MWRPSSTMKTSGSRGIWTFTAPCAKSLSRFKTLPNEPLSLIFNSHQSVTVLSLGTYHIMGIIPARFYLKSSIILSNSKIGLGSCHHFFNTLPKGFTLRYTFIFLLRGVSEHGVWPGRPQSSRFSLISWSQSRPTSSDGSALSFLCIHLANLKQGANLSTSTASSTRYHISCLRPGSFFLRCVWPT